MIVSWHANEWTRKQQDCDRMKENRLTNATIKGFRFFYFQQSSNKHIVILELTEFRWKFTWIKRFLNKNTTCTHLPNVRNRENKKRYKKQCSAQNVEREKERMREGERASERLNDKQQAEDRFSSDSERFIQIDLH